MVVPTSTYSEHAFSAPHDPPVPICTKMSQSHIWARNGGQLWKRFDSREDGKGSTIASLVHVPFSWLNWGMPRRPLPPVSVDSVSRVPADAVACDLQLHSVMQPTAKYHLARLIASDVAVAPV